MGRFTDTVISDGQNFILVISFPFQPAFVHLMRRFGCRLCRGSAMELSRALPHLKAKGVRCIAVGLEQLGVDEFVEGKFWDGELYIDEGKKAYKALQLQSTGDKSSYLSSSPSLRLATR